MGLMGTARCAADRRQRAGRPSRPGRLVPASMTPAGVEHSSLDTAATTDKTGVTASMTPPSVERRAWPRISSDYGDTSALSVALGLAKDSHVAEMAEKA